MKTHDKIIKNEYPGQALFPSVASSGYLSAYKRAAA